ncbi:MULTISPECIES: hypothetical protein [unclassified Streptomyces]|uniref:hypothetical protein n=1 Tax=unclassified Streptomyces TaxID=2593676 RepID=UPI002270571C|nr:MULTISPECIES: hypothetical protein [unclassified Streptomyces]MCY0924249.1 hypothetical protein [Streptomyces sp. H27-G5]MCY0962887.1 hypothetical protein [Streptomyces sp. H27-H5]
MSEILDDHAARHQAASRHPSATDFKPSPPPARSDTPAVNKGRSKPVTKHVAAAQTAYLGIVTLSHGKQHATVRVRDSRTKARRAALAASVYVGATGGVAQTRIVKASGHERNWVRTTVRDVEAQQIAAMPAQAWASLDETMRSLDPADAEQPEG